MSRRFSSVCVHLVVAAAFVLGASGAHAQRPATADGLDRLGDALQPAIEGGALQNLAPVIVVSARPAYEETRAWFPTAAVMTLADAFGRSNLRACEACMQPRITSVDGRLEYQSGEMTLEEIIVTDTNTRGAAAPARAAVWIDETHDGVTVRIVSLATGTILFAGNYDGALREVRQTARTFTQTQDVERRLRGESLTHVFLDVAFAPGQHISMDVVDQFGDRNLDMAGITGSILDPVAGFGAVYYRVIPEAFNLTIGAQAVVSVPTAIGNALGADGAVIDPLLTGVFVARWPIPQTSYGLLLTASTNGTFAVGVSLLNVSFLPVLP